MVAQKNGWILDEDGNSVEPEPVVVVPSGVKRLTLRQILESVPVRQEWIVVDTIQIPAYQRRRIRWSWVKELAKDFDPILSGPPQLNRREDGSLWVMDGQHRLLSFKEMGYGKDEVQCDVFDRLSYETECKVYYYQGKKAKLTKQEIFWARLEGGEKVAVEIEEIVRSHGFALNLLGGEMTEGRIVAVESLERLFGKRAPADIDTVLATFRRALGTDIGPSGLHLRGLSTFLSRYRNAGNFDQKRLIEVITAEGYPGLLLDKEDRRISTEDGVGFRIWQLYNYKRHSSNLLPGWLVAPRGQ